jgi:hypothetical protein
VKETLRHREAFEYYYILGDKRTLQLVANKFTVSRQSVDKWKREFNWRDRVELRDVNNGKKLEAKTDKVVVNSKADYRALIRKVVKEFEQKLKDKKIKISSPGDLTEMAKLDLLMMGESTERGELKIIDAKRKLTDKINSLASRAGENGTSKQSD